MSECKSVWKKKKRGSKSKREKERLTLRVGVRARYEQIEKE